MRLILKANKKPVVISKKAFEKMSKDQKLRYEIVSSEDEEDDEPVQIVTNQNPDKPDGKKGKNTAK